MIELISIFEGVVWLISLIMHFLISKEGFWLAGSSLLPSGDKQPGALGLFGLAITFD